MVNPRQKGAKGEQQVISMLNRLTNEQWTTTPGSGNGKIKGDLQVQGKHNLFCVIVRFILKKVIIFINGGVNFVNKQRI